MRRPFSVNVIPDICSFFQICCCCCCPPSLRIVFPLPHPVSNSSPITPAQLLLIPAHIFWLTSWRLQDNFPRPFVNWLSPNFPPITEKLWNLRLYLCYNLDQMSYLLKTGEENNDVNMYEICNLHVSLVVHIFYLWESSLESFG